MFDDEISPKRKIEHEIGQDLTSLSIEELDLRIAMMREEIDRLQAEKSTKQSSQAAAEAFFKS